MTRDAEVPGSGASSSPGGSASSSPGVGATSSPGVGATSPPGGRAGAEGSLRAESLEGFLDQLAERQPAPGGGGAAAITVAMAAGLVSMAARFTRDPPAGVTERTEAIRGEAASLADRDGQAYGEVLAAGNLPRERPEREALLAEALRSATDVPFRIAARGCEVASLASTLAIEGNPRLRGDARAAASLAEGATRAAAELVRINARWGELDEAWTAGADRSVREAEHARHRASHPAEHHD